jgi:hypothetical protein
MEDGGFDGSREKARMQFIAQRGVCSRHMCKRSILPTRERSLDVQTDASYPISLEFDIVSHRTGLRQTHSPPQSGHFHAPSSVTHLLPPPTHLVWFLLHLNPRLPHHTPHVHSLHPHPLGSLVLLCRLSHRPLVHVKTHIDPHLHAGPHRRHSHLIHLFRLVRPTIRVLAIFASCQYPVLSSAAPRHGVVAFWIRVLLVDAKIGDKSRIPAIAPQRNRIKIRQRANLNAGIRLPGRQNRFGPLIERGGGVDDFHTLDAVGK